MMNWARTTSVATATTIAVMVAGCQGSGSSSQSSTETVRATIVTAPADLQLLCASEAATRFGADPSQVLSTSSAQIQPQQYQVALTLGGSGSATCVVDDNGNILSLAQA